MTIQSVARAVALLKALDRAGAAGESLSALAESVGVLPTTAHNLLKTLVEPGFVGRDPATKHYVLGREARRLGREGWLERSVVPIAREFARRLRDETGETVIFTQYLRGMRRTLVCAESTHELRAGAQVGSDEMFYQTATGRVLLSRLDSGSGERDDVLDRLGLPGEHWPEAGSRQSLHDLLGEIQRRGVCRVERSATHVRAVAAPVEVPDVNLALGLYYPDVRHTPDVAESFEQALLEAAREISHRAESVDMTPPRRSVPVGV
jgi:IclR family transcriptional regulator, acetate operon repressor